MGEGRGEEGRLEGLSPIMSESRQLYYITGAEDAEGYCLSEPFNCRFITRFGRNVASKARSYRKRFLEKKEIIGKLNASVLFIFLN